MLKWEILAIWAIGSLGLIFEYFRNFWNHSEDSKMVLSVPFRIILEILSRFPPTTYDDFRKILIKFALTQSDLRYSLIVSDE